MRRLISCLFALALAVSARAATYTTDGTVSDTQTKINSAASGDTVQLPLNGSFTWSSGITISGKGITLDLNGSTLTRGTGTTTFVAVTNNATTGTRITGGTMIQSVVNSRLISVSGGFANQKFRIDHCTFTGGSGTGGQLLLEIAQAHGLIDNCTFAAPTNSEMIHLISYGAENTTGWSEDVTPGSADAVYIEDCTFTNNNVSGNPAYYYGNSAVQGYYGSRMVFRYNTLTMSQVDQHGGPISARWWEIYENTFVLITNGSQSDYIVVRGGSGVVFNNHKTGATNLGGGYIHIGPQGPDSDTYHVGLGKNLASDPAYVWGNDGTLTPGITSPVALNTDVFYSAKPGYTPYDYPYPWGGDATPPSPDPATIASGPTATSSTSFTVTATSATDAATPPVAYDVAVDGVFQGLWQSTTTFNVGGLQPNTTYAVRVKTRDSAVPPNVGTQSASANVTTDPVATVKIKKSPRGTVTIPN